MFEQFPIPKSEPTEAELKEQAKQEFIVLATRLSEKPEGFTFQGINLESYERLKANDEKYPGYVTPIDELIARFKSEGFKVVLGSHLESGNIYLLPLASDDVEQDGLFPGYLEMTDDMDADLKKLILNDKNAVRG